ncbi:uncharacterized protein TRUGW13939_04307 [Talaromyces rugulosus]|uniref:Uncharacterized protein n=1 Tax=Talaromyces rugulosus TaxID=121627 RepID=A0A7H8QTD0_TALRU|nr:uncharacterized protein TRUGW13939_04307 [Talaromyces rugulosus]QKX57199.1 hypothetical protein TRUGW13939_04307 [Talaromyces rugulosus]
MAPPRINKGRIYLLAPSPEVTFSLSRQPWIQGSVDLAPSRNTAETRHTGQEAGGNPVETTSPPNVPCAGFLCRSVGAAISVLLTGKSLETSIMQGTESADYTPEIETSGVAETTDDRANEPTGAAIMTLLHRPTQMPTLACF